MSNCLVTKKKKEVSFHQCHDDGIENKQNRKKERKKNQ
jgi:hypothetical protein